MNVRGRLRDVRKELDKFFQNNLTSQAYRRLLHRRNVLYTRVSEPPGWLPPRSEASVVADVINTLTRC